MALLNISNPYTSELISTLHLQSREEAVEVFNMSFDLFQKSPLGLSKAKRIEVLEQFYILLQENREELIQLSLSEGGKPLHDSIIEMDRALEGVKLSIQSIFKIYGEEIPMDLNNASSNKLAFTQKGPIGVVFAISAFNHPINLAVHQIIPAIAAGCPVIYKPALTTPLVSKKLIELLYNAGLPDGWCSYLLCDDDTTSILCENDKISHISFIGAAQIGWEIKRKIAPGVTLTLEHGGNAPVILTAETNIEKASEDIAKAGFYHAGQVCVSAQRIYVHNSILKQFTEKLKNVTMRQKVGDPAHPETLIGPIITKKAQNRIHQWIQKAIKEGASLICGGMELSNNCYAPTVLLNPSEDSLVSTEEIFGPVLCVYSYENVNNAIERANRSPYIFQSAAYTENLNQALLFAKKLNGSAVMINTHPAFRVDWMPFGGQGRSGEGLGGIEYAVKSMQKQKMVVIQH